MRTSLPAAVWEIVAPHFSQSVDGERLRRMTDAARLNAKAPLNERVAFQSDSAAKQAAAAGELRGAIERFARAPLEHLVRRHGS